MAGFEQLLGDWHFWALAIGYYLFMAVISGMPEPDETTGKGYLWAYRSAHIFSGNLGRLVSKKFPGEDKNDA